MLFTKLFCYVVNAVEMVISLRHYRESIQKDIEPSDQKTLTCEVAATLQYLDRICNL
jgi:hypothetical protein